MVRKRLAVVGVLLIILSTVLATQYATTKASFSFGVVHPSNADIRFVGSDNCSGDTKRVLRIENNESATARFVTISLGDWLPNSVKNYTAAFAICNEEQFPVNITRINVSGTGAAYISVWLHGNRTKDVSSEVASAKAQSVSSGNSVHTDDSYCEWMLGAGDGNASTMNGSGVRRVLTPWDSTSGVRYNQTSTQFAKNGSRDYVWVQISLSIPANADTSSSPAGQIWIHFKATTHITTTSSGVLSLGFGSPVVFESASSDYVSVSSLDSTHVVIGYQDVGNSYYGTAIVGTISGSSISFGSAVAFSSVFAQDISVAALDSTHVVIGYNYNNDPAYQGTAIVGTISGSSISFGSAVVFSSATIMTLPSISVASLDSTHVVIGYTGASGYGRGIVGTISGSSISFGTAVIFESANTNYVSVASLDSTHVVIGYRDAGNSNYGTAIVGTISGTSISYGSAVVFESASTSYVSVASLDSTHVVIGYVDAGNSQYGTAIVGTISGTSISFGSAVVFESASTSFVSGVRLDSTHVVVGYEGTSNYGRAIIGTISGSSISFGSAIVFESAATTAISVASLDSTHVVIGYQDAGNSNYGTAIVGTYS
jgi:hypothetical protein